MPNLNDILKNLKENKKRYKRQMKILGDRLEKATKEYEMCESGIKAVEEVLDKEGSK